MIAKWPLARSGEGAPMNVAGSGIGFPKDIYIDTERPEEPGSRQLLRMERDRQRGYSINVKQIVLAFFVEFVIIGLILTNIYVTVAQLPDPSTFKTVQA